MNIFESSNRPASFALSGRESRCANFDDDIVKGVTVCIQYNTTHYYFYRSRRGLLADSNGDISRRGMVVPRTPNASGDR